MSKVYLVWGSVSVYVEVICVGAGVSCDYGITFGSDDGSELVSHDGFFVGSYYGKPMNLFIYGWIE